MNAKKFTFKKHALQTGLAGVGHTNPDTDIKLDKKVVGLIVGPNWMSKDDLWRVRLMVKLKEKIENCDWKWVQLKAQFADEPSARVYLNEHFDRIIALDLRQEED